MAAVVVMTAATHAHADGIAKSARTDQTPTFGVMADVGLPDGGTASLVARPIDMVRLELGAAHNGVGPGVRGGVTWVPFRSWFTPVIGVAAGHFFERDANPLARRISGDPTIDEPMLRHFGYDFANAQLGLEFGHERFTFFIHAGITRVTGQIHDLTAMDTNTDSHVTVSSSDPDVKLTTVSAKLVDQVSATARPLPPASKWRRRGTLRGLLKWAVWISCNPT